MFRFSDEVERTMNQIYNQFPDDVNQAFGAIAKTMDKLLVRLIYAPRRIDMRNRYLEEYNIALSKIGEKQIKKFVKSIQKLMKKLKGNFQRLLLNRLRTKTRNG